MPETKAREPEGMTTAQLLGWAERCLELAEDRTDDETVRKHAQSARANTAAAIEAAEDTDE